VPEATERGALADRGVTTRDGGAQLRREELKQVVRLLAGVLRDLLALRAVGARRGVQTTALRHRTRGAEHHESCCDEKGFLHALS